MSGLSCKSDSSLGQLSVFNLSTMHFCFGRKFVYSERKLRLQEDRRFFILRTLCTEIS